MDIYAKDIARHIEREAQGDLRKLPVHREVSIVAGLPVNPIRRRTIEVSAFRIYI